MHVLMLSREDVHEVLGGDTIQMMQTKAGLEKQGVEVQVQTVRNMPVLQGFDLVHVFNWQQLACVAAHENWTASGDLPLILSPIFWFHTGHWFDQAVQSKWVWKRLSQGVGLARARALYEKWQEIKFRYEAPGRAFRGCLALPAHFLPNSALEIVHLESVFGLTGRLQARCTVVPNGITRPAFEPRPRPNQEFLEKYGLKDFVIQAARIQSAKNQMALIEALMDVPVPIVFAGQPSPYEPEYVQRCYEMAQRRGNVYFIGPVSPAELAGIYVLASVHVLPSWRETPGLASLEAAAAGCRIVSTSIGCTREYFGDEAWYCHPGDRLSIRRAVVEALAAAPSMTLREKILERYTWDRAADITLDVYHQVLNRSRYRRRS